MSELESLREERAELLVELARVRDELERERRRRLALEAKVAFYVGTVLAHGEFNLHAVKPDGAPVPAPTTSSLASLMDEREALRKRVEELERPMRGLR